MYSRHAAPAPPMLLLLLPLELRWLPQVLMLLLSLLPRCPAPRAVWRHLRC